MYEHPLKKQVRAERRKRNLVFLTVFILCFLFLTMSLLFGDMGLVRYAELKKTKQNIEMQIQEISRQNEQLKTQMKLLKEDPFYREKIAREEFGLSRPDEFIFQYDR